MAFFGCPSSRQTGVGVLSFCVALTLVEPAELARRGWRLPKSRDAPFGRAHSTQCTEAAPQLSFVPSEASILVAVAVSWSQMLASHSWGFEETILTNLPANRRARRGLPRLGAVLSVCVMGSVVAGCSLLLEVPEDRRELTPPQPTPDASASTLEEPADADGTEESSDAQAPPSEPGLGASEPDDTVGLQIPSPPSPSGSGDGASDAGSLGPDAPAPPGDAAAPLTCAPPESQGPNGRCYVTDATPLSWPDARSSCRSRGEGWDLAAIDDALTNGLLAGLITSEAWLGGSDADEEGTWLWVIDGRPFWSGSGATGSPVNGAFDGWNSDEPNGGGNSDCVRLLATAGTWADLECSMLRPSVCEGPPR